MTMTTHALAPFTALSASPLLRVFYDGSCGLCAAEMAALHDLDRDDAIALVDCAAPDFDDSPYRREGVTRAAMLNALHVRDILGDWHRGVDAIALLYATAGAPRLARLWAHPLTRPFAKRFYPFVVRHRHALSGLGLHFVSPRVLRLFAGRRPRCDHAACRAA
jgi:predicted DCC family thiol-disulfide oxidoreductase YuxK